MSLDYIELRLLKELVPTFAGGLRGVLILRTSRRSRTLWTKHYFVFIFSIIMMGKSKMAPKS